MNNDRIERYFGLMRYLSGMHMVLDTSSFCQNARAYLLWTTSDLCKNKDGSHNKLLCKSFFEEAQKLTDSCEKIETDKLFINSHKLAALKYEDILECKKYDFIPHMSGHAAKRYFENNRLKCKSCYSAVAHGPNMIYEEKIFLECSISHMNIRDNGGLHWPKEDEIHLCGTVISILKKMLMNGRAMNLLHESSVSSRAGVMTLKKIIDEIIKNKSCWIKN